MAAPSPLVSDGSGSPRGDQERRRGVTAARPKIAFIGGAGTVGSSAAFHVAQLGLASEILLVDAREHMAMCHVLDLEQANSDFNGTVIRAGSWPDLEGSNIVVLSASLPERNVSSRDEYLLGNVSIVREAAKYLTTYSPQAIVLVATNPIDVFTYVLARLTGQPARQVIGYSWNDTLRFRWAVARILGVPVTDVGAVVLGEHGETQVPLFDRITIRSLPVSLGPEQQREVEDAIRSWFARYQGLQSGRTTGWTSAVGIGRVIASLVTASSEPIPCSTTLSGEYGLADVSLGVPVRLGPEGVREIVELPLTEPERERMQLAANKVRSLIRQALAAAEEKGASSCG